MFLSFCVAYALAEPKNETQAKDSTSDISQSSNNYKKKNRVSHCFGPAVRRTKYIDEAIEAYRLFVMTKKVHIYKNKPFYIVKKGDYERALQLLEKSKLYIEPQKREDIDKEILEIKSHLSIVENASSMI